MTTRLKWIAALAGLLCVAALGGLTAALANPPGAPPGQDPCSHGNTGKPCRPDPQPDNGKDCDHHGNKGGVNEDHCQGTTETTTTTTPPPPPPPTTTTGTTSTQPTTPIGGTTTSTTPTTSTTGTTTTSTTTTEVTGTTTSSTPGSPAPKPRKRVVKPPPNNQGGVPKVCPSGTKRNQANGMCERHGHAVLQGNG